MFKIKNMSFTRRDISTIEQQLYYNRVRITSIRINRLFDIFSYNINLSQDENVLIITGPNGFGKTMILNVIYSLFSRDFSFFQKLIFKSIEISLDNRVSIYVSKDETKDKVVEFAFFENNKSVERITYVTKLDDSFLSMIDIYISGLTRVDYTKWLDKRNDKVLNIDDVLILFGDKLPYSSGMQNSLDIKEKRTNEILNSIQVHLIKEQRLFKKAKIDKNNYREDDQTVMTETIQTYAKELKQLISQVSQNSFTQTQELDSSYPLRLRRETNILSESEYEKRYNNIKNKRQKLTKFGLYESKQEFLQYSQDDAKALSVYIKDFELKLSIFDSLLEKLELFTNILNDRRFTFKSIKINRDKGFLFETNKGVELELNQLSSGEQHEVVLLYELIFNVKPNILVLIDEPEISLHVTWQKDFLNDLIRIVKLQNIQVMVATHSPSIINDRWDLVYNLQIARG